MTRGWRSRRKWVDPVNGGTLERCPMGPVWRWLCLAIVGVACQRSLQAPPGSSRSTPMPAGASSSLASVFEPDTAPPSASTEAGDASSDRLSPDPSSRAADCPPAAPEPRYCPDQRLTEVLAELDRIPAVDVEPPSRPLHPNDLELMPVEAGAVPVPNHGPGFFGSQDIDGDGISDVVLLFASVDFWRWLLFLQRETCLQYAGFIDAFQVSLAPQTHRGLHDLEVLRTPYERSTHIYSHDGARFAESKRSSSAGKP